MKICLFGSASNKINAAYIDAVEKLGVQIAQRGHSLVFGGGANGLMGAAARGVHSLGGEITGVVPKFFIDNKLEATYDQCTNVIYAETLNERKQVMEDLADAFIIVPGGIGTYDEFFGVLTMKQLGCHEKPIALFNILDFYDELEDLMYRAMTKGFIKANCKLLYMNFNDLDELFDYLEHSRSLGMGAHDFKDG